jgi:hypothetical protein
VEPGRKAVAADWYAEVVDALRHGQLPGRRGIRNPLCAPPTLRGRLDQFWPQFIVWAGETWAAQITVVWWLLRQTLALAARAEALEPEAVTRDVERSADLYAQSAVQLSQLYAEWNSMHEGSVSLHDPMYRTHFPALSAWLSSFGEQPALWTIKDAAKDEMYLEVAAGMMVLRGEQLTVRLPDPEYWRRTPWTPSSLQPGKAGLPPFSRAAS